MEPAAVNRLWLKAGRTACRKLQRRQALGWIVMPERLTILGASGRAAAFSAQLAGIEPYAIDLFADRDLAAVCAAVKIARYPADFPAALAAAPDSAWIYTGGLENHPRLVDRLANERPLLGNRGAALRGVRDPARVAAVAAEAGCRFPPSQAAPPAEDGGVWLVKPRRSSGGQAIRYTGTGNARPARAYWQKFIEGEPGSAVYVAAAGRAALLGASRQLIGRDFGLDHPFVYAGSIAPLELAASEIERLTKLGSLLAERLQLQGLFNVDFIRSAGDTWPLEVNPRYSASVEILEQISGVSFVRLHCEACQEQSLPSSGGFSSLMFAGKAVVYAHRTSSVPADFDALVAAWNQPGRPPGIADLPRIGQRLTQSEPVATVFAAGRSAAAVAEALHERTNAVKDVLRPAD